MQEIISSCTREDDDNSSNQYKNNQFFNNRFTRNYQFDKVRLFNTLKKIK